MKKKLKSIPKFKNEDEEREFWSKHEIVDYVDTSKPIEFDLSNLKPSTQTITLRMPQAMVSSLKILANKNDLPYQSLIKIFLAERLQREQKQV